MALSTAFTKLFGVRHPIASAPMGGSAGGALAAAVSRGGGLGLLGGAYGDRDWLAGELPIVADSGQPWGVGFLSWAIDVGAVDQALEHNPRTVMLSFGDPSPFTERVRAAGAALIIQVTERGRVNAACRSLARDRVRPPRGGGVGTRDAGVVRPHDRRQVEVALDKGRRLLEGMPYPENLDNHFVVDPAKFDFTATGWLGKTDLRGRSRKRFCVRELTSTARSGPPCGTPKRE
ncbi:nitronate monooxygenase [Streptomyces sp. Ag109_G2-15]|uniref:nitronate monooxygenase n=1 Tax=Streptomyces sp. Ag109_G2-15 TaxID=1938850 RepID=UPI000BE31A16|nr:nitronate monooxygenase [Streptomyces sp. Ag109_G2-15]